MGVNAGREPRFDADASRCRRRAADAFDDAPSSRTRRRPAPLARPENRRKHTSTCLTPSIELFTRGRRKDAFLRRGCHRSGRAETPCYHGKRRFTSIGHSLRVLEIPVQSSLLLPKLAIFTYTLSQTVPMPGRVVISVEP